MRALTPYGQAAPVAQALVGADLDLPFYVLGDVAAKVTFPRVLDCVGGSSWMSARRHAAKLRRCATSAR